jgi:hypothetical protein
MVTGPIQSRQPMALRHFAFLLALKLCILNNLFAIITHMWPLQDNTLRRKSDFFKWVSSGKAHYTCKPIFFEGCFPNLLDNGRLLTFLLFSISIIEVLVSIQDIYRSCICVLRVSIVAMDSTTSDWIMEMLWRVVCFCFSFYLAGSKYEFHKLCLKVLGL